MQLFILSSFAAGFVVSGHGTAEEDFESDMTSLLYKELDLIDEDFDFVFEDMYSRCFVTSKSNRFVLGVRSELLRGKRSNALGGTIELGSLKDNGFYWGAEFMGGYVFYGAMLNIGATLIGGQDKHGIVKNTFGISAGWQYKRSEINIWENDIFIGETEEDNFNFGGVFWRLDIGRQGNITAANRLLFGYMRTGSYTATLLYPYPATPYRVSHKDKFNLTYSLGIGWTFIKNRFSPKTDSGIYAPEEIADEEIPEEEQEEAEEIQGGEIQ